MSKFIEINKKISKGLCTKVTTLFEIKFEEVDKSMLN